MENDPSGSILMGGHTVKLSQQIKYLGVVLYREHSLIPHLDQVQKKVSKVQYKLSRLARATWGLKPEVSKTVYLVVAERIVLHAAPIWYYNNVALRVRLLNIQRCLLLYVTKCYSTVSSDALYFLSGVILLDLRAKIERYFEALTRWGGSVEIFNFKPDSVKIWKYPPQRDRQCRIAWTLDLSRRTSNTYYADGSRLEDEKVECVYLLATKHGIIGGGSVSTDRLDRVRCRDPCD